jgi:amino acid adenylation domain-containing protein
MNTAEYRVVRNGRGQYSIWPATQDPPAGWADVGVAGTRASCLAHVESVWTDIRPTPDADGCGPAVTLHGLVGAQARRTPDAVAVEGCEGTLTYAALTAAAGRVAHGLRRHGVSRNDLVGICADPSLDLVTGVLGTLMAGAGYVPLDPAYPVTRLAFMAEDAATAVTLVRRRLRDRAPAPPGGALALDDPGLWAAEPQTDPAGPAGPAGPGDPGGDDDIAYAIFTSGTTGRPKGVANTHRGVVNRLTWMQRTYRLGADDVVFQKTPISFDVSVWELFWPLMTGARMLLADPGGHRDPVYLRAAMLRHHVTTAHFVPSMLSVFLDQPGIGELRRLRRVICSGEELPAELARRFTSRLPWCELHNLYGPTEAAIDVSAWACGPQALRGRVATPIGSAIDNVQLHVLDEARRPVPAGASGELYIGGVGVSLGYLGRPALTAERFGPDPFGAPGSRLYRTGDLARWNAEGVLEFQGRIDHQVKLRGVRIELGEIESVLRAVAAVRDAVVLLREDAPGVQRLVAYLTPAGGSSIDVDAVRAELARVLPDIMIPGAFVCLESLPLTPNGKLDRSALPPPSRRRPPRTTASVRG